MKNHENYVAQQCFIEICHILKEHAGIYYRDIAQQTGIETSLFCRWLHNYVCLPPNYNEVLMRYFQNKSYARYKELFLERIMEDLGLVDGSLLTFLLKNMQYETLIQYLFCGLTIGDIKKEYHMGEAISEVVRNAIERKCLKYSCMVKFHRPENSDYNANAKNMFIVDIESPYKGSKRIVVYLVPGEEAQAMAEYTSIGQNVLKSKVFGSVDSLIFLRMPILLAIDDLNKEVERYGDFAARKIIQIIKKIS